MRATLLLFILSISTLAAWAQDEDYYAPEKTRKPMSQTDLNDLHRWGPKMGIEAWGSVGYSHFYTPSTIQGGFKQAVGGLGYDVGIGPRMRIYHKLAIAFGFQFSGRGYSTQLQAYAEVDTGTAPNNGAAGLDVDVSEKMNMQYLGFYIKPVIELSRKFHLAILFHPSWELVNRRKGYSTQTIVGGPSNLIGSTGTIQNESSFELEPKQFELGLEFAYKWMIAPQLILKPHFGINFATSAIFHTGAELPTPFGGWEQNPSFMTLRFGAIFETGLWLDKPKTP
ncbi:MAG: hypothetical protein H6601_06540 [Flavobacteriales bacterium]|nr:hypothetical protein [Flavobacteriales bacterium]